MSVFVPVGLSLCLSLCSYVCKSLCPMSCLLVSHFLLIRQFSVIREDVHQTTNDLTFSKALIYSFHFFPFFTLLSVLRTFIYDPLVEWQRTKGRELLAETSKTGEVTNEEVRCPVDGIWLTERVKPRERMWFLSDVSTTWPEVILTARGEWLPLLCVRWLFASHFLLQGVKILKDIEKRFKGFEGSNRIMIPLSIEGQVHYLINVSQILVFNYFFNLCPS